MKKSIAVIGAGIAGLTVAYRLRGENTEVTVFESSFRTGGVIKTDASGGYLVENGPNTIQTSSDSVEDLIRSCGLSSYRIEASIAANKRYVVRGGVPHALPMSPASFLSTPVFSWSGKFRLLKEPFIRPAPADVEESVAEFVERRLGRELLDYAMNPFVAGVYAGDPEKLSLKHAFPKLFRLEQEHGSLIRGMFRKAKTSRSKASPAPRGKMISFTRGLQMLPDALTRILGTAVKTGARVLNLQQTPDSRWKVTVESESGTSTLLFDTVIYTAPLHQLPTMFKPALEKRPVFSELAYPPVSIIALGFERNQVTHPLDGFGMLVPQVESEFKILGTLFSSTLFDGRAPDGHVLLTSFIGGTRHVSLASGSTDTLIEQVLEDLRKLLGVSGQPTFASRVFRKYAIPQYNVGYGSVKSMLDGFERSHGGLFFAGNYRDGISVNDTITCATGTAVRIAEILEVSSDQSG